LVLSRNALINLPVTVYQGQWRVMVLLGLGSLAAAATVGLIWGDRLRERIAAERSSATACSRTATRRASSAEPPARVILVRASRPPTMAS
jgi:hypothetical protein